MCIAPAISRAGADAEGAALSGAAALATGAEPAGAAVAEVAGGVGAGGSLQAPARAIARTSGACVTSGDRSMAPNCRRARAPSTVCLGRGFASLELRRDRRLRHHLLEGLPVDRLLR